MIRGLRCRVSKSNKSEKYEMIPNKTWLIPLLITAGLLGPLSATTIAEERNTGSKTVPIEKVVQNSELEALVRKLVREIHKKDFSTFKKLIQEQGMYDFFDYLMDKKWWEANVAKDRHMVEKLKKEHVKRCVRNESGFFPSFFALYEVFGDGYPIKIVQTPPDIYEVFMDPNRKKWGCHFVPLYMVFVKKKEGYFLLQYRAGAP